MRLPLLFLLSLAACGDDADHPADAGPPCPADPPAAGVPCDATGQQCSWLRCDGDGAISATCSAAAWNVGATPCPVDCHGMECASDQLCSVLEGGALIANCVDDPCDGAPLEACACSVCPDPAGCRIEGLTVRCNNCFSEICP